MKLPFTTRRACIREEALAWLARLRRGLRRDEGSALLEWLKRRSHRACIARAAADADSPEALAILGEIFAIKPKWVEPPRGRGIATSAVVALIAFALAALPLVATHHYMPGLFLNRRGGSSLMEAWGTVYASDQRTLRRVGLADGTRVVMNRQTRIAVVYSEHLRAVLLVRGEATFTVARESHRPFHLTVADRSFETQAGTFNVRLTGRDALELTVLEGLVIVFPSYARTTVSSAAPRESAVRTIPRPTLLRPSQTLDIEPGSESARTLSEHDTHARIAWQRG